MPSHTQGWSHTVAHATAAHPDGSTIAIRVVPGAPRTEFVGGYGTSLKLKVHAPTKSNAANAEICRYLARLFAIPARNVIVVMGKRSRDKVILVAGQPVQKVSSALKCMGS